MTVIGILIPPIEFALAIGYRTPLSLSQINGDRNRTPPFGTTWQSQCLKINIDIKGAEHPLQLRRINYASPGQSNRRPRCSILVGVFSAMSILTLHYTRVASALEDIF